MQILQSKDDFSRVELDDAFVKRSRFLKYTIESEAINIFDQRVDVLFIFQSFKEMNYELGREVNSEIPIYKDAMAWEEIFRNALHEEQISISFRSYYTVGPKTAFRKCLD